MIRKEEVAAISFSQNLWPTIPLPMTTTTGLLEVLITLKACRILQGAPVILYDNLCNTALLDWASSSCEKIYVGKLPYGEYTSQETIHALIKEKAFTAGKVIRLKGGDPFIFGRGF